MVNTNSSAFKKRETIPPVYRRINIKYGLNQTQRRRFQEGRIQIRKNKGGKVKLSTIDCAKNIPSVKGIQKLEQMMHVISSEKPSEEEVIDIVREFRQILDVQNPSIEILDKIVNLGVIPYLVIFLNQKQKPALIFESMCLLRNIAATCKDRNVVHGGAVPYLIELLEHGNHKIRNQAICCLGDIAKNPELRNFIIHGDAINGLILNIEKPENILLLDNAIQAILSLCKGRRSLPLEAVAPVLESLMKLLCLDIEYNITARVVWAISYMADADDEYHRQRIMEAGLIKIVEKLKSDSRPELTIPAARCIGSLVHGDEFRTEKVLNYGILEYLPHLLEHSMKNVRKEACRIISNVAGGTTKQICQLFRVKYLLNKVVDLAKDGHWEVRREAMCAISNVFMKGSDEQVIQLVQYEGLSAISLSLKVSNLFILINALEALERVLQVGEKENLPYGQILEEYKGKDRIERLSLEHPNQMVCRKCENILFLLETECEEDTALLTNGFDMYNFELLTRQ